jgi:transposase
LDGIEAYTAVNIVSEIGPDMSRRPSEKHFTSWLALCPGSKVSGGKRLSGRSKRSANHAAEALCMAAHSLHRSRNALGACLRRQKDSRSSNVWSRP